MTEVRRIEAGVLDVAYLESGPEDGWPVVLLHGFPYDVHAYDEVAPILAGAGARVIVPWLRGYGPTQFLSGTTPRSGEQAVLGDDLRALMDALDLPAAVLAGYDWGGRAACIVAALWPERCRALVSCGSYNIQNIARSWKPAPPEVEHRFWYQYYFHSERGRRGLAEDRRALCQYIWSAWSPDWAFTPETFGASAAAFDNPDFVDVVIHSYRHRYGLVPGDPRVTHVETALTAQPPITVPAVTLDGLTDGVDPGDTGPAHARWFTGPREHRRLPGIGHNVPQEAPAAFAQAVMDARAL